LRRIRFSISRQAFFARHPVDACSCDKGHYY
jgi:hypothetical protein